MKLILDVDAIKIIFDGILNTIKNKNSESFEHDASILIITHNPKVLDYLKPDYVHIMIDGKIIRTGNLELVKSIESTGYKLFESLKY